MKSFAENFDEKTHIAADRFIKRIKDGVLHKRYLPNTSEDYPIKEAAESFDKFLKIGSREKHDTKSYDACEMPEK